MNSQIDYKQFTILFVDDEPQSLKYFERMLNDEFSIRVASDADEAWQIIQSDAEKIGVLISDERMPGMTGAELLERVRVAQPQILRVLTTAYSDLSSAINAVNDGGAFAYITKPWALDDLRGTLRRALDFHRIDRERRRLLAEKLVVRRGQLIEERLHVLIALTAGFNTVIDDAHSALEDYLRESSIAGGSQQDRQIDSDDLGEYGYRLSHMDVAHSGELIFESLPTDEPDDGTEYDHMLKSFATPKNLDWTDVPMVFNGLGLSADFIRILSELTQRLSFVESSSTADPHITIRTCGQGQTACLEVVTSRSAFNEKQIQGFFSRLLPEVRPSDFSHDIIPVCFLCRHHGLRLDMSDIPSGEPCFRLSRRNSERPTSADWIIRLNKLVEHISW